MESCIWLSAPEPCADRDIFSEFFHADGRFLITISNLTKLYARNRGLLPTSFLVNKGELIAIVGHNGAGKSTLLKMVATWVLPDSGQLVIDGIDLSQRKNYVKKVGFVPETPSLFDLFSVTYNLKLFALLLRTSLQRVDEIIQEFDLAAYRKNKIHTLSKGLKQRVNIGRALLADPPVLLFDEPTTGLDFEMTHEIYRLLASMHTAGKTILFTSHRPEEIKSLATRIMVLHEGSVIFDGPPHRYFGSEIHEKLYA